MKTYLLWIQEKKTTILIALSILLALFLIILSFVWNLKEKKLEEMKTAHALVGDLNKALLLEEKAKQDSDNRADMLKRLAAIVQNNPELQRELGGFIAQEMIIDKEGNIAPWAEIAAATLNQFSAPEYAEFSTISAATSEHKVEEAKQAASQLRRALEKENQMSAHPALYTYTLLQIASCAKLLQQDQEKEEALSALKTFDNSNTLIAQDTMKLTEFIEQL